MSRASPPLWCRAAAGGGATRLAMRVLSTALPGVAPLASAGFRPAARLGFRWEDLDVRTTPDRTHTPPLLAVHAIGDRSTRWADGAAIATRWPRAALPTTEGLGHRRLLGDAAVIRRVAAFLRDAGVPGPG